MEARLVQDLTTARGGSGISVVQSASSWLELGDLEDLALYLDVREASAGTQLTYETSPATADASFLPLVPEITVVAGLRTDVVLAANSKVPPARFLRWKLSPPAGGSFDVTFRIWVAAYGWAQR